MNQEYKKIAMIGLGYIGLPTAAVLASRGVEVLGVDINQNAVDIINSGGIHIIEPDLDEVVHEVVKSGFLRASTTPEEADVFIIAVPTPFKEDYKPDLSYVKAAAKSIAPFLRKGNLVILESTSPVGATETLAGWLADMRPDIAFPQHKNKDVDVHIAYCPERVLPGKVLTELVDNDRIVGGMTLICAEKAARVYRLAVKGQCIITNARTAEMCKLTENSFRDVNIAFANELSLICDKLDINVWELIRLANHHPRVNILQPGPGVGGHCIAVDPWFIVSQAPAESRLIRMAREVNDAKPEWVVNKVKLAVYDIIHDNPKKTIGNIVVACFGLSFKANIDDLRESPALKITEVLADQKFGTLLAVEPNVSQLPASISGKLELVSSEDAIARADVIVILVDHEPFLQIEWASLHSQVIIDTRGVLSR